MLLDRENGKLLGVCAGIAKLLGLDAGLVRFIFVVAVLFGGVGAVTYLILWLVMYILDMLEKK
jgi:phage shock protein PspC (stress-responsive transcriptional regulator)